MNWVAPSPRTMGAKGLPVAIRARPSVQFTRSPGTASTRLVGLESGKMIGRSTWAAIERTISSVKWRGWPLTPISAVGWRLATVSAKLTALPSLDQAMTLSRGCSRRLWPSRL